MLYKLYMAFKMVSNRARPRTGSRSPHVATCVWLLLVMLFIAVVTYVPHVYIATALRAAHSPSPTLVAQPCAGTLPQWQRLKYNVAHWQSLAIQDAHSHGVNVSGPCLKQIGDGVLHSFRTARSWECQGDHAHAYTSSVQCRDYPLQPGMACSSRMLVIHNATGFMGPPARAVPGHTQFVPSGGRRSVVLSCSPSAATSGYTTELLPWFKSALHKVEPSAMRDLCTPGAGLVDHPVLFVTRLDPTNPYHHMLTVLHVYMSLAALGSSPAPKQVRMQSRRPEITAACHIVACTMRLP
jgi:hypothetical protein